VMVHYSLALMLVVLAMVRRSPRVLFWGGLAVGLGALLAAFYLLPAAYEGNWVNIAEVLAPGVRPQDNFLFTIVSDNDHNRFNLLVSTVALAEMVALAGAAALSQEFRRRDRAAWWTVVLWSAAAVLLMLPFTFVAWQHLPKLRFVQLPWRWLLCLNVGLALLVTFSFRRWIGRALLCLALLTTLWMVWHRVQGPWWDQALDIKEMKDNILDDRGYEGTDEYVPAGADPYEIDRNARRVTLDGKGPAQIRVRVWEPEVRKFEVVLSEPAKVAVRLFNYPAWQVEVNGHKLQAETREVTGQMILPLAAGENEVQLTFARTRDRLVGSMVSLTAGLIVVMLLLARPRFRFTPGARP
jgi:hypothetical protein